MKKLFLAILTLISITSFSQTDSSRLKPTAIIQARDCEVILYYLQKLDRNKFQDLDSALLKQWRPPATNPTGTTNVTIDSVEARVWYNMYQVIKDDLQAVYGGTVDRLSTNLTSTGHSWLTNKVVKLNADYVDAWTQIRQDGRQYGKKEKSGF